MKKYLVLMKSRGDVKMGGGNSIAQRSVLNSRSLLHLHLQR